MFILVMAFSVSMALAVALRKRVLAKKQAACERSSDYPFCQLHSSLLGNREFFSIYLCRMGKVFGRLPTVSGLGLALEPDTLEWLYIPVAAAGLRTYLDGRADFTNG